MSNPVIRCLLDENTPRSVEIFLKNRGHDVVRAPGGASDDDILAAAELDGRVIVTADKDFKNAIKRNPAQDSGRYKQAGLIKIEGEADQAIVRLTRLIEVIERVYESCQRESDKRIVMHIRRSTVWIDF